MFIFKRFHKRLTKHGDLQRLTKPHSTLIESPILSDLHMSPVVPLWAAKHGCPRLGQAVRSAEIRTPAARRARGVGVFPSIYSNAHEAAATKCMVGACIHTYSGTYIIIWFNQGKHKVFSTLDVGQKRGQADGRLANELP